ncbi:protein of unknown function [Bradyrhizobium vignae]|uniref:Uncharacterized protein n=1 Tax=Bradyrhizobium vignae TaxID=1549949 RepID=A0A2U3Q183_9BRAD|nr:protein of unknown function [Bradyrhizobium vignae]
MVAHPAGDQHVDLPLDELVQAGGLQHAQTDLRTYLPGISEGFRHIAEATSQLKPTGAVLLQLGAHGSYDLRRLELAQFRSAHAEPMIHICSMPKPVSRPAMKRRAKD